MTNAEIVKKLSTAHIREISHRMNERGQTYDQAKKAVQAASVAGVRVWEVVDQHFAEAQPLADHIKAVILKHSGYMSGGNSFYMNYKADQRFYVVGSNGTPYQQWEIVRAVSDAEGGIFADRPFLKVENDKGERMTAHASRFYPVDHPFKALADIDPTDLHGLLLAAGVPVFGHESDLHCPQNDLSVAIVQASGCKFSVFMSKIEKVYFLDVPFQFSPYWDKKNKGIAQA